MGTPETPPTFQPERLVAIRCERGLRQKDLAQATGRTPGAVGRLETGDLVPSRDWLEEIAKVLHVRVGDLLAEAAS